jgi:hypothetical protein
VQALRVMQNTPYCDFLPTGTLHTALPSISVATVKMKFFPVDVDERGLNIFGPLQGLSSERPSYHGYRIDGVRNLLSRFQTRMIDFEVRCFVEVSASSLPIKCLADGHSWCRTCFHNYLAAASGQKFFPLTYLGNEGECTERISLYAAKDVLSAADFDATVSAAFDTYVQTHPDELHYCPTPDCPQVFRPALDGIFLQCPSCLVRICPTCNADAHDGLTCAESKDRDDLFKHRDVKRYPGCNIAIVKDEGCKSYEMH